MTGRDNRPKALIWWFKAAKSAPLVNCSQKPDSFGEQLLVTLAGRGRDNTMYGQERFIPGEATLKGGIVLGLQGLGVGRLAGTL